MEEFNQPAVVILDPRIDPDRPIISDDMADAKPHFTVAECGKSFFGRSSDWIRNAEAEGWLVLDGEEMEIRRTSGGRRYYTLWDIERMAHALAQQGRINGQRLRHTIVIVQFVNYLWEMA